MIVLDAFAIEAYLVDEPAAEEVRDLFHSGEQLIVSAVNLAEVVDRMLRVRAAHALELAADLAELPVTISSVDGDLALAAAELRARHYHRVTCPVSVADCCAAALALDRAARLATSDPALLDLLADEACPVLALPSSTGVRHQPMARVEGPSV